MRNQRILAFALMLVFALSWAVPAMASEVDSESAATVQLTKTVGEVAVTKSSEKPVSIRSGMRLYDGYNVTTDQASYAWINLDNSKLIKMDASSSVEIRKKDKLLEVNVKSGSAFFDVSEKLDSSENLNIRTATMAVGIRGTSGWASVKSELVSEIHLLDGTCECAVCDPVTRQVKTGELHGGEMASCVVYPQDKAGDKCDIIMGGVSTAEIPGFVLMELVEDVPLCDTIQESSGLDILADLAAVAGGNPSGRSDDGKSASPQVVDFAGEKLAEAEAENAVRLQEIADAEAQLESNVSQDNVWGSEASGAALNGAVPREGRALQTAGVSRPSRRPATSSRPTAAASAVRPTQTSSATQTAEVSSTPTEAQPAQSAAASSAPTQTSAPSARPTVSVGPTVVPTGTQGPAHTPSASSRPTSTARPSATSTGSPAPSASASPSASPSASASASATASPAPSASPSVPVSPTVQPTQSSAPQPTRTIAPQPTYTTSPTAQPTFTQAPTINPTPSPLPTPSSSSTGTATTEPSPSPTAESTPTESPEPTEEPSSSLTPRPTYTVELDYNTCGGPVYTTDGTPVESVSAKTDEEGHIHLSSLSDVTRIGPDAEGECRFLGWFTERIGGAEVSAETVFSEDTTIYAHWEGWILRDRQLIICGQGPIGGYNDLNPAPWWRADVVNAVIDPGVTGIGDAAFAGCSELSSVEIPDSVTRIDSSAFAGCRSLASIEIPSGVTSIEDYTFYGCDSLTSVTIPTSVTSIGNRAFEGCPELTVHYAGTMAEWRAMDVSDEAGLADKTIVCSDGTIEPVQRPIYTVTFNYNCDDEPVYDADGQRISAASAETDERGYLSALPAPYTVGTDSNGECTFRGWFTNPAGGRQITAEEVYTADATIFAHWAGWCVCGTKLIYFGPGSMPEYGDLAPWSKEIQSAVLMEGVTSISPNAFIDCSNLTSVELPDTLTSIGSSAFAGCSSLRRVEIPDGVTSIGDYTFYGCEGLQTVQIPESVVSVGNRAFEGCPELTVHYAGTMAEWRAMDVSDEAGLTDKTIVCSDGTIEPAQRPIYTVTFNYNCDGEPVYDADGQRISAASAETDERGYLSALPAPYTVGTDSFGECTFRGWFTSPAGGRQITAEEVYTADATIFAHWTGWCVCGTKLIYFGPGAMPEYVDLAPWSKEIQSAVLMEGVTSVSPNAFIDCTKLTSVGLPDTLTSIGEAAFYNCSSLTNVEIPQGITNINDYTFGGCESLQSIQIPDSVASIGNRAFEGCPELTVHYAGTMVEWRAMDVSDEAGLADKTIVCSDGTIEPVQRPTYTVTFDYNCDGESVYDADGQRISAASAETDERGYLPALPAPYTVGTDSNGECTFRGWFTSPVGGEQVTADETYSADTTIFAHWEGWGVCGSKLIYFGPGAMPDYGESAPWSKEVQSAVLMDGVTSISPNAFTNCSELTSIELPDTLTSIGSWAFAGTGLTSVVLPDGITSIEDGAFYACSDLASVTIPMSVTRIDIRAFMGCPKLTVHYGGTMEDWRALNVPYEAGLENKTIVCSDGTIEPTYTIMFDANGGSVNGAGTYVTKTDEGGTMRDLPVATREVTGGGGQYTFLGWFTAMDGGTRVTPGTVFEADATVYAHWDLGTSWSLEDGTLTFFGQGPMPDASSQGAPWGTDIQRVVLTEGITSVASNAFVGCASLETITIPASVSSIGTNAFYGCGRLTSVTIPDKVSSIGSNAFGQCTSLQTVSLPSSVVAIANSTFSGCTELNAVTIPSSVTSIGDNAFGGCSKLTGIAIPTSVKSVGSSAFAQCSGLVSIEIPSSVTSIGNNAFQGCSSLESVALQASISTLNQGTFMDCTSLTGIRIPDSVTSIGSNTFQRCSALDNVTIPVSITQVGAGAFTNCPLRDLQYQGTVEQWNSVALASDSGLAGKTIQCSNGEVVIPSSGARSRKLFAVTLDAGGGTCESSICWPDVDGKLANLPEPEWEGHTFEGWFTAKEDGELVTVDTVFDEDTTIYAHWKEDNSALDSEETASLIVKLEACGGTLAKTSLKTDASGKLTDLPKPTREGYTFDGWFTAKTGGQRVSTGTELSKDATLYAHWSAEEAESAKAPDTSFTVKFSACGGTVSPVSAKTDKDGKLSSLPSPTWEGHVFTGWYTAKSGGTKVMRSAVFTKNTTLYAHWIDDSSPAAAASEAAVCTIRFDACGGAVNPASMKTDEDGKLTSLPVPTWKGHEFQGWYADKKNGSKVTTSTVFEMNTKLYARWKELEPLPAPEPAQTPAASSAGGNEASGSAPSMEAAAAEPTRHDADPDQTEGANNA